MPELDPNTLYTEVGQLYRHYLSWREKLLGGYVAIIAALAVAIKSNFGHQLICSALALIGVLLTVVFWLLDIRNSRLFHICRLAGTSLESNANLHGVFTALNEEDDCLTHSKILYSFFFLACIGLTGFACMFWFGKIGISTP